MTLALHGKSKTRQGWLITIAVAVVALATVAGGTLRPSVSARAAGPTVVFSQGFETDIAGWLTPTRVASGTNGVVSRTGGYHAEATTDFTRWGGYNFGAGNAVPTAFQEYSTKVDIYLNVAGGWANNTRFDFSSAINNALGTHNRDFIFNGGFYNDSDASPGSGSSRFVISASNNSQPGSAFAKNPASAPIAISTSGWFSFEHHFYDNGGVLAVEMSIFDAAGALVSSWTLSDPTDLITGIGGNRYGWFDFNEFPFLAIDNSMLTTPPGVATEKQQCKDGGWQSLVRADDSDFKNQGDCVSYTNNGK